MLFSMSTIVAPGYVCMSILQVECYMDCPLPGMVLILCVLHLSTKTGHREPQKTTGQLIKLYTTIFFTILLGGKVIEGIGRALLVEEDHIIIDFLSDRLITGHV